VAKGEIFQGVAWMKEDRKVGVNVRFDPELHDRLRRVAFEQRRKQSDILREALREYLNRLGYTPKGGEERR